MWSRCLLSLFCLGLVAGAALRQEAAADDRKKRSAPEEDDDKSGMVDDYEFNVATNCREYPAFGVTDPRTCSQMKQDGSLNYNPVVGNNWAQGQGCDAGWATNQGQCYKLEQAPLPLTVAAGSCGGMGGQLVNINNMETNLFVKNLLANSGANSIFLGAKSDAPHSMKWMVGINAGDSQLSTDFSNMGQNFENGLGSVTAGQTVVMKKGADEWEIIDNTASTKLAYVCQKAQPSSNVGFCRWDAFRANTDVKSACMCPTSMNTCAKRSNCFWYEDPNSPFKECISNSERFYNMLHRLLVRRGKKDFAIKIRYGSTPARGHMPFGPYGPSIIGAGNPNPTSMFGVYGHKNPYDRQRGMRMPPQMMGQMGQQGHQMMGQMGQQGPQMMGQMGQQGPQMMGQHGPQMMGQMRGQQGQQPWGQRQQVYHEGNRFNPYKQQNHKQY